jgi:DnaJ-class molecular chaperone
MLRLLRRFGEVSEAYEVLSDRARREEYDAKIKSTS